MPKRLISSDFWSDGEAEKLSYRAKYLFLYLITSPYTSQAGIGQATDKKIANDTDLQRQDIPVIFGEITMLVERLNEWFWVKNFFRHQCCNTSFAKGAFKYAKNTPFVDKFIAYNQVELNRLNINTNINRSDQIRSDQEVSDFSEKTRHRVDTVSTPCLVISTTAPTSTPLHDRVHVDFIAKALGKLPLSVSPEEVELCKELFKIGCTYSDIEAARLKKNKNSLKWLRNTVCECRDSRLESEALDDNSFL